MTQGTGKKSPFFDEEDPDPNGGVTGYRRDQIYRYLFDNTDRYGIIVYSIIDLARAAQVDRHRLGFIFKEFVEMGLMDKVGKKYRCLVDPDEYDWGEEFLAESKRIRKKFQYYYKQKEKEKEGK
jgi:hypothetical protein